MLKVIGLMKRRPGLSMQAFIAYYETTHARLGEKYLSRHATRYMRRFLHPIADPYAGVTLESEYDAVLEMWFPDRAAWDATQAEVSDPLAAAEIAADEEQVFDRPKNRFFFVEEHESVLIKP